MFTMPTLGEILKFRAKELKLTDAEVARRLGIGKRRYNNWAKDERTPDRDMVMKICVVLNLTPNELYGFGEYGSEEGGGPAGRGMSRAEQLAAQMSPARRALWFQVGDTMLESPTRIGALSVREDAGKAGDSR